MRIVSACASMLLIIFGSPDAASGRNSADRAVLQRASSSAEKQAYVSELTDALDRYEREVAAHKNDDPASIWLAWATYGYRLHATNGSSLTLLVLRKYGSRDAVFAIGREEPKAVCASSFADRRTYAVEGESMVFDGQCIDGVLAYVPHAIPDRLRLKTLIENRRSIGISGDHAAARFDLAGVPVLRAKLDAEALVPAEVK